MSRPCAFAKLPIVNNDAHKSSLSVSQLVEPMWVAGDSCGLLVEYLENFCSDVLKNFIFPSVCDRLYQRAVTD